MDLEKIRKYGNIEFLARQTVEGFITGLHKSPYHGFSVEFAEHKQYNTGEDVRHIDWKVYAKTDKLFVKQYEEETNLRCLLIVDDSSSMYYPEVNYGKITFSTMGAAALAYMLQKQRDAVGLCTFDQQINLFSQIRSTSNHVHTLFAEMENLLQQSRKHKTTNAAEVLHKVADKLKKRSLIVIFSDMFDNENEEDRLFYALQHLKHNKHEILLFHVVDKKTEEDFVFDDRPYEFTDLESGDKVKLNPSQYRDNYKKYISGFTKRLKMKCNQFKIDFIEADINQETDQILTPYLIKRRRMKIG